MSCLDLRGSLCPGILQVTVSAETVTIYGLMQSMMRKTIISQNRFVVYDESDLSWAEPLGLCKIERNPYRIGDVATMDSFVKNPELNMRMILYSEKTQVTGHVLMQELCFSIRRPVIQHVSFYKEYC